MRMKFSLAFLAIGLSSFVNAANTYYVWRDNPTPQTPYDSWETAATEIQAALDLAEDGDSVLVKAGVYDTGGVPAPGFSITNRVCATNAVDIRGVEEDRSLVVIQGAPSDSEDGFGTNAVRCVYLGGGATLSGFTLTGGYTHTNNQVYQESAAGGVFINDGSIVENCTIVTNFAAFEGGGAVCYEGGVVSGCEVAYNDTRSAGGGVSCYFGGRVENSEIHDNYAYSNNKLDGQGGGGINAFSSGTKNPMTITNCFIYNNETKGLGGAIYFTRGPTEIVDCVISNNHARRGGGVWANIGGAIRRCVLVENSSTHGTAACGSGAYMYHGAILEHSIIARNYTPGDAAGIHAYNGDGVIDNCLIFGNIAGRNYGGGIIGASTTMKNCTVVDNETTKGDCGGVRASSATSTLRSSIVWGNNGNDIDAEAEATVSYVSSSTPVAGEGNLTSDPRFKNAASGNYRLSSGSPCIDSGFYEAWMDDGLDLDGQRRIRGKGVDRGVYEYVSVGSQIMVR